MHLQRQSAPHHRMITNQRTSSNLVLINASICSLHSSATPYLVTLADKAKQYAVTKERIDNHKKLVETDRDRERYFSGLTFVFCYFIKS